MRTTHLPGILSILLVPAMLFGADKEPTPPDNSAAEEKSAAQEKAATVDDIPTLARQLDSDDFDERDEAKRRLSELGAAALKPFKALRSGTTSAEVKAVLDELIRNLTTHATFDMLTPAEQIVAATPAMRNAGGHKANFYGIRDYRIYEFDNIRIAVEKFPTTEEHMTPIDIPHGDLPATERGEFERRSYRISYKLGGILLILPAATVRLTQSQLTVAGESLVRDGRRKTVFLTRGGNLKMIYHSEKE